MSNHHTEAADVHAARRRFFEEGAVPAGGLSHHIERSWQRCRGQVPGPEPLARAAFASRLEASRRFIDHALPEMDMLAEQMSHTRSVLILTDAQGLILEEGGSSEFLRRAQRVALQPGVDWSERQCGTNAIGTALVERQALEVRGAEHYLDEHRILHCAAAPILSPRGEVLGVLDVSGSASEMHQHALALVKLAGEQIEHRLIHADGAAPAWGRRLLRFHAKAPMLGTAREAVFLVDDDRVVGANTIALRMLGLPWGAVLDRSMDELFDRQWRTLGQGRGTLITQGGIGFAAAWQAQASAVAVSAPRHAAARTPPAFESDETLEPLLARAVRVLDAGSSVLLQGETGCGKDVFAGLLHQRSARARGPFVALNCAALPETLVEAELFGYAEGAFTGAQRKGQLGRVREADGGVLFLDEIGDMPLLLQSRLLRVLQERSVTPLGGGRAVPVDFALVCATHRDLAAMVEAGSFRADLFYRLQDYIVQLPALRERQDIPALVERLFVHAGGRAMGLTLAPEAVAELASRPWPGNLRQLASTLRTLVALADPGTVIHAAQLPPGPRTATRDAWPQPAPAGPHEAPAAPVPDGIDLRSLTAEAIDRALAAHGGRVSAAARALGVHRSTVYRHLLQKAAPRG
ncbi:sigma-54-dependent Fis family transcriptional regulator [Aquincola sp. MAHUQ-54]|uniref:Sigma-54-dependent Fis family transcriptional regulator n=1 Tax=Aquincola agrisoli TaxID=3119538 RepID=A0AAW9QJ74_9BURK